MSGTEEDEDKVSSLEAARQRRNGRALRAVVSVHEDIGASQTRRAAHASPLLFSQEARM